VEPYNPGELKRLISSESDRLRIALFSTCNRDDHKIDELLQSEKQGDLMARLDSL